MGKPTGFMEYQRLSEAYEPVDKRLKTYKEFVVRLTDEQASYLNILDDHLRDVLSPFLRNLGTRHLNLTPKEIQVASLIREGKTSKEIADVIGVSARAVDFHRDNIRIKLGIKNKKANLRSFLLSTF